MKSITPRQLRRHQLQMKKLFWRNYVTHSIEGGFFMGGMSFLAADTVLPVIVKSLGGSTWLVAMTPILMLFGWMLPSLLIAHYVEKLDWVRPLVLVLGVFQRLPYVVTGFVLVFFAEPYPTLALAFVMLCPLVSGICGGVSSTAWQELIAKTIPENRRSSLWAARNIIGALFGLLAGGVIAWVLWRWPGSMGYGVLHWIAFGFFVASYAAFTVSRETNLPARPSDQTPTFLSNIASLPALIRANRPFRLYLVARALTMGQFIMLPFLAIHALRQTQQPESFVGLLVTVTMAAGIGANLLAGWLGDRFGGKILLLVSSVSVLGICVWASAASDRWEYLCVFGLLGVARSFHLVGTMTLSLEICPMEKRATYLAVISAIALPAVLAASAIGAICWRFGGERFLWVAIVTGLAMLAAITVLAAIAEPRKASNSSST